ncbi:MAG: hypothetical protein IKO58_05220 [Prevotella sp.]|nr:hypothetical protein [Prevotella sp.]
MKKLFFYASLVCISLMWSCSKEYAVDEENLPEWLGESIYSELQNPKLLDGTFNTYLRLVDDLGYSEVLSKTGSKTIFPANDAAFEAFFKDGNNKFGKSSYEELTKSEKAQLLFASMLDNAILLGNLSSQTGSNGVLLQGQIVKHPTNIQLVQSVEPMYSQNMPANNPYFAPWKDKGLSFNALYDNTTAPMVHFSGEYFLNNAMTVTGSNATDFKILTGHDYVDGCAYVFDKQVMLQQGSDTKYGDVTCQNGYIHQLDEVLVNPGNMAQILRANSDTKHISRMMDYFAVPVLVEDETFRKEYAEYSTESGAQDPVYAIRYLSKNSQRAKLNRATAAEASVSDQALLSFDPGWNNYNPTLGSGSDGDQAEIAAILCPTDDVIEKYFSHDGAYIVKNLGVQGLPYDEANIKNTINQHLDAIHNSDPKIFTSMLNNILKPYLSKTVPSKFSTVQNDAFEFLEDADGKTLSTDHISLKADGNYDVQIANNGVIYKMNTFFAPLKYNSVLGPASVYTDLRMMGEMLNDKQETAGVPSTLGADMYYYLVSMKSKYAVFNPTDNDNFFYIDPASITRKADGSIEKMYALKFTYEPTSTSSFKTYVQRYEYNPTTNALTLDPTVGKISIGKKLPKGTTGDIEKMSTASSYYSTQIKDMLNYHTVVLDGTSSLSGNHYYLTKHGGAIYVADKTASSVGTSTVQGPLQIGTGAYTASKVTEIFNENSADARITNGTVYRLDSPIQPAIYNTHDILSDAAKYPKFQAFFDLISGFSSANAETEAYLTWCGILKTTDSEAEKNVKKAPYIILDNNSRVAVFGTYNYTLYVPEDMSSAFANGLGNWNIIENIYNNWEAYKSDYGYNTEDEAKDFVKKMIDNMRSFILYHMQNNSVFKDDNLNTASNETLYTNDLGIAKSLSLIGSGSDVYVKDAVEGRSTTDYPKITGNSNILVRDISVSDELIGFDDSNNTFRFKDITSSSFVVIHGIDKPLCYNTTFKYDD